VQPTINTMLQVGNVNFAPICNPAENKFSTTEKLTRFDRTKFISAMMQTENISNQHALRL